MVTVAPERPVAAPATPTVAPYPVSTPHASHVVIELFGGDNNLNNFVNSDLAEMASALRSAEGNEFAVLALVDVPDTGAEVIEVTSAGQRNTIETLGQIDTGDPETLAQFIARALVTYPRARRALGFWDHGSGVFGEDDPNEVLLNREIALNPMTTRRPHRHLFVGHLPRHDDAFRAMLHDFTSGGVLTNYEAYGVLRAAFARAGERRRLDLIFSDTCLNGMVEVVGQFRQFASVVVGSEELEPGDGWEYDRFIGLMAQKPPRNAAAWGQMAVKSYEDGYRNRPNEFPVTMAAFRTSNGITSSFKTLVAAAQGLGRDGFSILNDVRAETQCFAGYNSYDLRDFAARVAARGNATLAGPAQALVDAFDGACLKSVALGSTVADAHGLAFWFPSNKQAYQDEAGTYARLAFPIATGWAEFLRNRYS